MKDTGDVYFVPAFSGLYAPYWEMDARGMIVGLTNYTDKSHLCRATLEAVCFQSREVRRGGKMDDLVGLQLLADILGISVGKGSSQLLVCVLCFSFLCLFDLVCPKFMEMTVRGVAIAYGGVA